MAAKAKFDKVKMVNNMVRWVERFDQRLHAGEQIAVVEEILFRFSKDQQLKDSFDELVEQIRSTKFPQ